MLFSHNAVEDSRWTNIYDAQREQKITTPSANHRPLLELLKHSPETMCSLELFRLSSQCNISARMRKEGLQRVEGGLCRQRMMAVYYYIKMWLGPLVKAESCGFFPSAL